MSAIQFARIMLLFPSRVMSNHSLHIIDANFNRTGEGLCVLEDMAHLSLNDYTINLQLKTIHHNLTEESKSPALELLYHRDSQHNIIANLENHAGQMVRKAYKGFISFITANAKKVEKSLTVIDELSRLPEINIRIIPFRRYKI